MPAESKTAYKNYNVNLVRDKDRDHPLPKRQKNRHGNDYDNKNKNNHVDNHDDDDFSVNDMEKLDDPTVPALWKPLPNKVTVTVVQPQPEEEQQPKPKHRWKIGETVEVLPNYDGPLSDFCNIVGTNPDGTYNLQSILTGGWKKSVSAHRILGNYDDITLKGFHNTKTPNDSNHGHEDVVSKGNPVINLASHSESDSDDDSDESESESDSDDDSVIY